MEGLQARLKPRASCRVPGASCSSSLRQKPEARVAGCGAGRQPWLHRPASPPHLAPKAADVLLPLIWSVTELREGALDPPSLTAA